ncbi:cytochrome P450 [Atractiella rhizophila]|nr:cytochrome P450 [Atractiella rhizophila]
MSYLYLPLFVLVYIVYRFYVWNAPLGRIPTVGGFSPFNRFAKLKEYAADPIAFLQKAREEYGEAFTMDLLIWKWVFFVGPKGTMALANLKEEEASFFKYVPLVFGRHIEKTVETPNNWFNGAAKSIRTGLLGPGRHSVLTESVSSICSTHFSRWASSPDGVDFFSSTSDLAHAHGFTVMFGRTFATAHMEELLQIMADFEEGPLDWRIRFVPYSLWGLFEGGRRVNGAVTRLQDMIRGELRGIYAEREKHEERPDFLYYLTTVHEQKYSESFAGLILITLFAFWANLVPTMCWTVLHAYSKKGTLERWREELEAAERVGEEDKMGGKPFMDACMRETGRLYSLLTVLRLTSTRKYVQVLNTSVPPGTTIVCSPLASGHDENVFEKPEEWRPERFLEEAEEEAGGVKKEDFKYQRWIKNCEFYQFGIGQHACPGEKLARFMMVDRFFAGLARDYDIEFVGLEEGDGVDGVGAWADWVGRNYGTPFQRGEEVKIKLKKKTV